MMTKKEPLEQKHIDAIVAIFHTIGVWNTGAFSDQVAEYCKTHSLDTSIIHKKLEVAFRDYLATNMKSEAAMRFRLSQVELPKNAAL